MASSSNTVTPPAAQPADALVAPAEDTASSTPPDDEIAWLRTENARLLELLAQEREQHALLAQVCTMQARTAAEREARLRRRLAEALETRSEAHVRAASMRRKMCAGSADCWAPTRHGLLAAQQYEQSVAKHSPAAQLRALVSAMRAQAPIDATARRAYDAHAGSIQTQWRRRRDARAARATAAGRQTAAARLQAQWRDHSSRARTRRKRQLAHSADGWDEMLSEEAAEMNAAVQLQAHARGRSARRLRGTPAIK